MKNNIRLFVSYAHEDKNFVENIIQDLSYIGFPVWYDDEIHHGDNISSRIVEAIENSTVILFFSSKHSNGSDWCVGEVMVAIEKKKRIIPIKIDATNYCSELVIHLISKNYVDFTNGFSTKEFDKLKSELSDDIYNKKIPTQITHLKGISKSSIVIVFIFSFLLILFLVGEKNDDTIEISSREQTTIVSVNVNLPSKGSNYTIHVKVPQNELKIFTIDYRKKGVTINVHEDNICSCTGKLSIIKEIVSNVNEKWNGYELVNY